MHSARTAAAIATVLALVAGPAAAGPRHKVAIPFAALVAGRRRLEGPAMTLSLIHI